MILTNWLYVPCRNTHFKPARAGQSCRLVGFRVVLGTFQLVKLGDHFKLAKAGSCFIIIIIIIRVIPYKFNWYTKKHCWLAPAALTIVLVFIRSSSWSPTSEPGTVFSCHTKKPCYDFNCIFIQETVCERAKRVVLSVYFLFTLCITFYLLNGQLGREIRPQ